MTPIHYPSMCAPKFDRFPTPTPKFDRFPGIDPIIGGPPVEVDVLGYLAKRGSERMDENLASCTPKKDYKYLLGERSASVWADAFEELNPGVMDKGTMLGWFANAIETGCILEAKARTKRERQERHIQSIIDGWKKDELENANSKLRFKSSHREAEERLVKRLLDAVSQPLPG